jgi:hypothetical protein
VKWSISHERGPVHVGAALGCATLGGDGLGGDGLGCDGLGCDGLRGDGLGGDGLGGDGPDAFFFSIVGRGARVGRLGFFSFDLDKLMGRERRGCVRE